MPSLENSKNLAEFLRKSAEKILLDFCESYRPPCARSGGRLLYEISGTSATLFVQDQNCSSCGRQPVAIAQLRFNADLNQWTLHYRQEQRWQFYLNAAPSLHLHRLLKIVEEDPLGLFFHA